MAGCSCGCKPLSAILFSCSGSADVGELADRACRKLAQGGIGQMSCLAGISGGVGEIVEAAKQAVQIVVIDGCALSCAQKTLERASLTDFIHMQLGDLGFEKDSSEVSAENVQKISEAVALRLREIFGQLI